MCLMHPIKKVVSRKWIKAYKTVRISHFKDCTFTSIIGYAAERETKPASLDTLFTYPRNLVYKPGHFMKAPKGSAGIYLFTNKVSAAVWMTNSTENRVVLEAFVPPNTVMWKGKDDQFTAQQVLFGDVVND